METCKQQSEIVMRLPAISIYGYVGDRQILELWASEWAWQTFLDQSMGIDETNTFQLKFFF